MVHFLIIKFVNIVTFVLTLSFVIHYHFIDHYHSYFSLTLSLSSQSLSFSYPHIYHKTSHTLLRCYYCLERDRHGLHSYISWQYLTNFTY
jgi:hypothetical protein